MEKAVSQSPLKMRKNAPMSENSQAVEPVVDLESLIEVERYAINDPHFMSQCKSELDKQGVLVLPNFLNDATVKSIAAEGLEHASEAFYTVSDHNVYLKPTDESFSDTHIRNREVSSSKGCITTDQIPSKSSLRARSLVGILIILHLLSHC